MNRKRVYVAGHNGMVGSAIVRLLSLDKNIELVTRSKSELDLMDQQAVNHFFQGENIDQVYLAAAKVGGIHANDTYPADFIYQNLMIQSNVIHSAHLANVQQLLFLGSSCIYPKHANQPMDETQLLTGGLEPTNEPYAIAKIAGIKLCESYHRQYGRDYRSVMPTNLYGINDNFHPENSHVLPALIQRFHQAKIESHPEVVVWGSGNPKREFLYVDDLAQAAVFVMDLPVTELSEHVVERQSHLNIGTGVDCSIKDLSRTIAKVVGFTGSILFDSTKPDGAPRKLLNVNKINELGWKSKVSLEDGINTTYQWYLENT